MCPRVHCCITEFGQQRRFCQPERSIPERGSVVSAMPLFHTAGCGILVLGAAQRRMSIGLIQYFDPTAVLDAAEGFHADVVSGVPTMLIAMINDATFADRDFSACSGGRIRWIVGTAPNWSAR